MNLLVLRHGKAGPALEYSGDAERALTDRGKEEISDTARWLASRGYSFDRIATSPVRRASETAEIVAAVMGQENRLETWDSLSIGGDPRNICRQVARQENTDNLMIIGHEPSLSIVISRIISGGDNTSIALPRGGLAKIRDISSSGGIPRGELHWLLTPRQIQGMK